MISSTSGIHVEWLHKGVSAHFTGVDMMVTSSSTSVTSQKYKTTRSVGAGTTDFKSLRLPLIHGRSDEFKTAMCERESTQTVMISSKVFH